ncbi:MAG: glycosyltransferase family 2 protein [Nitrososphaerota archaeon]
MKNLPTVSVIIVNYNGIKWLRMFFESIIRSNYHQDKLEIILVDNGSLDGSVDYIREKYRSNPNIKIVENGENLGYANAVNKGIENAKGEVFFCISNDVELHPDCIKEIVDILSNREVGIVQPKVISIWDRKSLDSGLNYLDIYGYSYGYVPFSNKPLEVTFAEGIAWATRKDVINRIGKMEEYYFMEYDDQDICWRSLLAGYKNLFVPSAIVYHVRGGTQGKTLFDRTLNAKWYVTNHITTLIKNSQLNNLLRVIPVVIFIEIAKVIYLSIIKQPKLAINTLSGLFIVLKDFKKILKKRYRVQREIRKVSDDEIRKVFHRFMPNLLYPFLLSQKKGKRFILKAKPLLLCSASENKNGIQRPLHTRGKRQSR